MSAVYDKEMDCVYISSSELVEYVSRGGDIGAKESRGNKNGGTVVYWWYDYADTWDDW